MVYPGGIPESPAVLDQLADILVVESGEDIPKELSVNSRAIPLVGHVLLEEGNPDGDGPLLLYGKFR